MVNDAFSGKRPLGPLATEEGARLVRERLGAQGVYLANVRSSLKERHAGPLDEALGAFAREFAHIYLFPEYPDEPERLGYNAMAATDVELPGLEGYEWS